MKLTRRTFMKVAGGVTAAVSIPMRNALALTSLKPAVEVDNPLDSYPDRNWEDVYRNQYKYDRSFAFCCSPNDTHQCRVRAFVRNEVVIRVEQDYEHQNYGDIEGRTPQQSWNPRM